MPAPAAKTEQPKNATTSQPTTAPRASHPGPAAVVDQRPATVAQRQRQELISQSPRVQQAAATQARIAQSPRQQAAQLRAAVAPVQKKVNKTGLPDHLKAGVESLSGYSMDDVRVHYNSAKPAGLQAHAYAQGADIHLAPGQERHLPHEAWHVVQQKQGRVKPTLQLKGTVPANDDGALEKEADAMGQAAIASSIGNYRDAKNTDTRSNTNSTVQLAAPGRIEHVLNSCFVAALINIFTGTPSLKDLLNPATNALTEEAKKLQNLLLRAVNTVDINQLVPQIWVKNIMASLAENDIIASVAQPEDVNSVLARVVAYLQQGHADAGQANSSPAFAMSAWRNGTTITQALDEIIEQAPYFQMPNVLSFNRSGLDEPLVQNQAAPPSFTYADVSYRLTAVINRNADDYTDPRGNKQAHFVTYVDRSGIGNEWYESDDVGPRVKSVPNMTQVGAGTEVRQQEPTSMDSDIAKKLKDRRKAVDDERDDDEEEFSARPKLTELPVVTEVEDLAPRAFNAMTHAITYVYQRSDVIGTALTGELQHIGNDTTINQVEFTNSYMLKLAKELITQLDADAKNPAITASLIALMMNPVVHEHVASNRTLFSKMYVDIKSPEIDKSFRFSTDSAVDEKKREQRIHAITDQITYLLHRLRTLSKEEGYNEEAGTELIFNLTQTTAKEAEASTLAKLVALYADEEVRMPVYSHRVGPMRGGIDESKPDKNSEKHNQLAAKNLNAILTSTDEKGSNLRVTDAAAGPGAYLSTDSDNFYGPHGVAFDPRDVHQLPLSKSSTDNKKQHSSERRSGEGHQFRAVGVPIPFFENNQNKVAETFVGRSAEQSKDLPSTLQPDKFNRGVLPLTPESIMRDRFRQAMGLSKTPTQAHTSSQHDQPKGAEEVYLVQKLIIELEGLYEPTAWAALWQEHPDMFANLKQSKAVTQMLENLEKKKTHTPQSNKGSEDVADDEWED